jgi:hypothetical protein
MMALACGKMAPQAERSPPATPPPTATATATAVTTLKNVNGDDAEERQRRVPSKGELPLAFSMTGAR